MTWLNIAMFLLGYFLRHLAGIAFSRIFKKKTKGILDGSEFIVDAQKVETVVVSMDKGKTWFYRDRTGWVKVNYEFIISLVKKQQ